MQIIVLHKFGDIVQRLFYHFRILGRPSQDEWPDDTVSIKWESFKVHERVELTNVIPNLCENAYDLIMVHLLLLFMQYLFNMFLFFLQKMLTFDPAKRINAFDALQHVYFTEEPLNS